MVSHGRKPVYLTTPGIRKIWRGELKIDSGLNSCHVDLVRVVEEVRKKKMAPLLGPSSRGEMVGVSGKAMQDAVPPNGTAWVVTRMIEESEGHTRVCGLLVTYKRSICRTKVPETGGRNVGKI
jgi:hypothetical protein